jgi:hypothetical protein
MALTLEKIRTLPGFENASDDEIISLAGQNGVKIAGLEPPPTDNSTEAPKPEEAGALRSYVGIPLLQGTADIGGTVGYGLEKSGIAPSMGQALQNSAHDVTAKLEARKSQAARDDHAKTLVDDNGDYGGYNMGTLAQDVFSSAPSTIAMGMAGAPLAKGVTAVSKAIGIGEKVAKIAGTGALGKSLAAGLDTAIGSSVGFGAAEGAYSGASNAAQIQHEIRNADINVLARHPAFIDTYHNETDPALSVDERLFQTRDLMAHKAGDDVFADTLVKTGLISAITGGGVFGVVRVNAAKQAAGEAVDGAMKRAGKGFMSEGAQEGSQSAFEQRDINQAKRDYTDQNQDVNQGVLNAGLQGGIAGGVMGMGGVIVPKGGHAANDKLQDNQLNIETPDDSTGNTEPAGGDAERNHAAPGASGSAATNNSQPAGAATGDAGAVAGTETSAGTNDDTNASAPASADNNEGLVLNAKGKPFSDRKKAELKNKRLGGGYEVVDHAGGFALKPLNTETESNEEKLPQTTDAANQSGPDEQKSAAGSGIDKLVSTDEPLANETASDNIQPVIEQQRGNDPAAVPGTAGPVSGNDNIVSEKQQEQVSSGPGSDGSLASNVSILDQTRDDWVNKAADATGLNPTSKAYKDKRAEIDEAYDTELDKALAHAPFETFANHPSNEGVPKSLLHDAYESLREYHDITSDTKAPIDKDAQKIEEPVKQQSGKSEAPKLDLSSESKGIESLRNMPIGTKEEAVAYTKAFDELRNRYGTSGGNVRGKNWKPISVTHPDIFSKLGDATEKAELNYWQMPYEEAIRQASFRNLPKSKWIAERQKRGLSVEETEKTEKKPAKSARPSPKAISDKDDILAAVAKLGGLNADEAQRQGVDPAHFNKNGSGIMRVFTKTGKNAKTYDEMAEALRQYGFDVPDANALVDQVSRAVNQGEKLYTPRGHEHHAAIMAEEKVSEEQARHVQRLQALYETAQQHDSDFGTNFHDTLLKLDDLSDDNLSEWEQDLHDDRQSRAKTTDDQGINGDSQTSAPEEHQADESGSYAKQEIAKQKRQIKQSELEKESDTTYSFPNKSSALKWGRENITGQFLLKNDIHDPKLHHVVFKKHQAKTVPVQWYLDADDKPVLLQSDKIDGERGPFTKKELSDIYGFAKKDLSAVERPSVKFSKAELPSVDDFAQQVKDELGLKAFYLIETGKGDIELTSLIVNKDEQKSGKGTAAMERLIDYSNRTGKRLVLTPGLPNDNHGTTSRARLVKFYKKFGFVESKGRNIDYALGAGKMYRDPRALFSRSQPITGSTVDQIKSWLPERVKGLVDAGKLIVVQSVNNLPNHLMERGSALYHAAWHGSPHDFDIFSTDNIGTGEGAQAFGYGLYFTDKKDIAEWYRKGLSNRDFIDLAKDSYDEYFDPDEAAESILSNPELSDAQKELVSALRNDDWLGFDYPHQAISASLKNPDNYDLSDATKKALAKQGNLYQVELAPEQDEYLDWDSPISEQSQLIRSILESNGFSLTNDTGEKFYRFISRKQDKEKGDTSGGAIIPANDKAASEYLHSLGIRGIRYSAEGGKSDAKNYVVFSDDDVSITAKYSKDLSDVEGLYDETNDKLYLVADMLNQDNINQVLLHELYHRAEATDEKLQAAIAKFNADLKRRFYAASKGMGSAIEQSAYKRVMAAGTKAANQISEFKAYMVSEWEKNPDSVTGKIKKAIADFVAAIRVALFRAGMPLKSLSPADLAALAKYVARVKSGSNGGGNGGIRYSAQANSQSPITNINQQGDSLLKSFLNQKNADTAIYNLQDRYVDLKRQMEKVVKQGVEIEEIEDAYMAEELSHQRIASRIKEFYDKEFTPILKALHDNVISLDYFEKFLHARHAPSRNEEMAMRNPNQETIDREYKRAKKELDIVQANIEATPKQLREAMSDVAKWGRAKPFDGTEEERLSLSGMSNRESAEFLAAIPVEQRGILDKLGDAIDKINNETLDLTVSYGMEKPQTVHALKKQWQHYVPLHRDEAHPEENNFGNPVGRGFSVGGSGFKSATGSNSEVTNIMAHIAASREQMILRGEKNRVMMRLAGFVKTYADADFAEIGKVPMSEKLVNGLVESLPDPTYKNRDNVVLLRVKGRDVAIVFNEYNPENVRLSMSLKNMDGADLDKVESLFMQGTRWFGSVNTQYNIIFGLINLTRDTQGMMLNLSSTPLHGKQRKVLGNMGKALKIISAVERGWQSADADPASKRMYDRFNKAGGTTGYSQMFENIKDRNKAIQKELTQFEAGMAKRSGRWMLKAIKDYNTVMENVTRLAVFMAAIEAGLSDDKAASIAKNITVNFNRKGAYATKLGAFYAFFNASMQGSARLAETMAGPKGKQILLGGVGLGAALALIGLAWFGEDDWEKIPEFVRERSFILPAPWNDSGYISIPMPLGFHILPNIGRKIVEAAFGSNRVSPAKRFVQLAGSAVGAFNPLGGSDLGEFIMPTVLDPAVALWRNKDWTGRAIYRDDFSSLKPTPGFTRKKDTSSSWATFLAEHINKLTGGTNYKAGAWSPTPDQIDYVFGQIFGGTGREVMKLDETVSSLLHGEELPTHKIPLVGRLYGETSGNSVERSNYYDNIKMLNEHAAEIKGLRHEQDGSKKVSAYLLDNPEARLTVTSKGIQAEIDKLNDRRRELARRGAPSTTLRALDDRIGKTMKRLNDQVAEKLNQ